MSGGMKDKARDGARLLVANLEAQGVDYVFGIPGAKIDPVFDALVDSKIKTVVCRHEQNATFIAGGLGRITGKAGVVLVTSGPGCSNLVTGLATANTEGDPIVAMGGAVPVGERLKQTHQSMDTVAMMRPVTKYTAEIDAPEAISEALASAFRAAEGGRPGAAFLSLPKDVMKAPAPGLVLAPARPPLCGPANAEAIGPRNNLAMLLLKQKRAAEALVEFDALPGMMESFYAITVKRRFPNVLTRPLLEATLAR